MSISLEKELIEDIFNGLENKENLEDIAKRNKKSIQEIKAILARIGDERSKHFLKQIIKMQVPKIEEITKKYIEEECSPDVLSKEYGIYQGKIRQYISEYAYATNQEKGYTKRRSHKESTMYKPKSIREKETQISIVIDPNVLKNQDSVQEGEDR